MSACFIQRLLYTLIGCIVILAMPTAVCAQESTPTTPDLIVTVRDESGAPLSALTVQIGAGVDTPLVAQARTDAQGQATFGNISTSQVRVRVTGRLASGTQLYQPGEDAPGMMVLLGPPPTSLDLRVDSDGMVLPDPTTMIDKVPNGPVIATPAPGPEQDGRIVFPTSATFLPPTAQTVAVLATAFPTVSPLSHSPLPSSHAAGAANVAPADPSAPAWLGWMFVVVLLIVGGVVGVMLLGRRPS